MSQALLRGVLPVGMGLIVCTMGVLFLSAAGLLHEPAEPEAVVVAPDSTATTTVDSWQPVPGLDQAAVAAGDGLFKNNCAQCHGVNEIVVGPALGGIEKRRPEKWLLNWVKNPAKIVASGDPYAVALYEKFGKQQMPSFQLSDKEVLAILEYVKSETGKSGSRGADNQ